MLYTWGPSLIWWSILLCGKVTYLSGMVERVGMVERGLLSSPGGLISRTKLGNSKRQYAHMVITSWLNIFWLTCLCSSGDKGENKPSVHGEEKAIHDAQAGSTDKERNLSCSTTGRGGAQDQSLVAPGRLAYQLLMNGSRSLSYFSMYNK